MIGTLRKKFIAINMALVSVVLAVMCAVVLIASARKAEAETITALQQTAMGSVPAFGKPEIALRGDAPHSTRMAARRVPAFWVLVDQAGVIQSSDTSEVDITEETLTAITAAALADAAVSQDDPVLGVLDDPDLRYLVRFTPAGALVAFADRSTERSALRLLALRLAAVLLPALAAFWCISLFLARWALRPVEKAWQQQRQFVADASHELKTPLTVILANADIMARHPEAAVAEQRQWLDGIREEGARMKQLIDDLLFLARADALRTPALCGTVDWSETVESAALAFESVAFEKGVTLQSRVTPGLLVTGDGKELAQLAGILLDNACKYAGGEGQVDVVLEAQPGSAVLQVTNTGATLTPQQLEHLFERFYRADAARSTGGYGLGLAIAQSIVQMHHGHIRAESARGSTTLTVTLPLCTPRK
ncbi:MAG: sensor histidine kinase [Gemmiger sp.]